MTPQEQQELEQLRQQIAALGGDPDAVLGRAQGDQFGYTAARTPQTPAGAPTGVPQQRMPQMPQNRPMPAQSAATAEQMGAAIGGARTPVAAPASNAQRVGAVAAQPTTGQQVKKFGQGIGKIGDRLGQGRQAPVMDAKLMRALGL